MSIFEKDPEFDLNDYFRERCKIELPKMHGASHADVCRTTSKEENLGFAKSLDIQIKSWPDDLKKQYDNAIHSLERSIYTVRSMGFEVYVKELTWRNIKDSCYNICGDKGFFFLTFRYVKSQPK